MQRHTHTHTHGWWNTSWEWVRTLSAWVWSKSADQLVWVAAIDFSSHLLTFGPGEHFHDNAVLINGGESYLSLQSVHAVMLILRRFLCMFIKMTDGGRWYGLTGMSCNPGSTFSQQRETRCLWEHKHIFLNMSFRNGKQLVIGGFYQELKAWNSTK